MKERNKKTLQQLDLADDYLFAKVMVDEEICRLLLEKILNVTIRKVQIVIPQKTIEPNYVARGVRLDVYLADDDTIYSVEMQQGNEHNIPKRSRYYQGMMDMDQLDKGTPYVQLKRDVIIFICTFDSFGEGRAKYTFETRCVENLELPMGDEAVKVVLNTRGMVDGMDPELAEFLRYVEHTDDDTADLAQGDLVKLIHQKVKMVKEDKRLEVEFMKLMEHYQENWNDGHGYGFLEGREAGLEEGRQSGLEEGRQSGLEEGRQSGLEEGRQSGLEEGRQAVYEKALKAAKKLKDAGVDTKTIAECQDLLLEVVERL